MNGGFRHRSVALRHIRRVLKRTGTNPKGGERKRKLMESNMITKSIFAAAALAIATAATPITTAEASQINFNFGIQTPDGYFSFGTGNGGGYGPQPSLSCYEARQYLKADFKKVNKVECNGSVYTFHVKEFWGSPWMTVKINSHTGDYWFV
jgi:hypothetical protein